jgi:hypothetical protein
VTAAGFTPEEKPPIMLLPMTDPLIKDLRRIYGKARNGNREFRAGISERIFKQLIGDRWVEEAYAYRIS